tara:strand:- start:244 stop:486 length:243 start_codon:yes stop_codon:yes gene_type:complete
MKRSNRSSTLELLIATCSARFVVLTQRHEVVCEDHDTILTLSFARGNDQKLFSGASSSTVNGNDEARVIDEKKLRGTPNR